MKDKVYQAYNRSPLIINLEWQFKYHKQSELTLCNIHLFVHDSQQWKELFDNVAILSTYFIPAHNTHHLFKEQRNLTLCCINCTYLSHFLVLIMLKVCDELRKFCNSYLLLLTCSIFTFKETEIQNIHY